MPLQPSLNHVAQAIYDAAPPESADSEKRPWEEADTEPFMKMARAAVNAIEQYRLAQSATQTPADRYNYEQSGEGYAIFDKTAGRDAPLGTIHDSLVAQQIVDQLNRTDRSPAKQPTAPGDAAKDPA